MRSSTRDTSKGILHEAKGKVKETTGKAFGNVSLETEGKAEKIVGKVQKNTGKAEKNIEDDLDVETSRRGKY